MILSLFDVSGLLHTGENSKKGVKFEGLPMDGIIYALRTIIPEGIYRDDIVVCFDSKTNRKSLIPSYKTGRNQTNVQDVSAQADLLYNILIESGVAAIKVDGFEADDLIYTCVEKYKDDYSFVRIFTNDADIAHNVNSTVSIEPVSTQSNGINIRNYRTAIKKGEDIYLGTVTLFKLFKGDSSDKIPAFRSEKGFSGDTLYREVVKFVSSKFAHNPFIATNRDFLDVILRGFSSILTEKDVEELKIRAEVFYPRMCEQEIVPSKPRKLRGTSLHELLYYTKQFQLLNMLGSTNFEPKDDELKRRIRNQGRLLTSGAFGSMHGISFDTSVMDYDSTEMRSF